MVDSRDEDLDPIQELLMGISPTTQPSGRKSSKPESSRQPRSSVVARTPRSENEEDINEAEYRTLDNVESQGFHNSEEDSAIDLITQLLSQQKLSDKELERRMSAKENSGEGLRGYGMPRPAEEQNPLRRRVRSPIITESPSKPQTKEKSGYR